MDHGTIPPTLSTYFKKTESRHHHATRQATSGKYQTVKKLTKIGNHSFQSIGTAILNKLKDMSIYTEARSKKHFLLKYKELLVAKY